MGDNDCKPTGYEDKIKWEGLESEFAEVLVSKEEIKKLREKTKTKQILSVINPTLEDSDIEDCDTIEMEAFDDD